MDAWPPRDGAETGPLRRASLREMQQVGARPAPAERHAAGALQLQAGGYGYGLRVSQTCDSATSSRTPAACPDSDRRCAGCPNTASGSWRWAPYLHRLGTALSTRRSSAREDRRAEPRQPAPSPRSDRHAGRCHAAGPAVGRRARRSDRGQQPVSRQRRRSGATARSTRLRAKHGTCRADGHLVAENALRGEWMMPARRGAIRVAITLAPDVPPRSSTCRCGRRTP